MGISDVFQTGSGPLGWICCCGCFYKCSNATKSLMEANYGRYTKIKASESTPLEALPKSLRRFRGNKGQENKRKLTRMKVKERGELGAENIVETLKMMPALYKCLDHQYHEEMRAFSHFVLLIIQSAKEHLARE